MANTYGYQPPAPFLPGSERTLDSLSWPMSGTINLDDFLIASSGVVSQAATNAAVTTLAGIALKKSADIYFNATASDSTLFGTSTVGTALTPSEPKNMQFYPLSQGSFVEMSLVQAYSTTATLGATVGLTLDATTTFFVADTGQANKIGVIAQIIQPAGPNGNYGAGDTGIRVLVQINAATAIG